jgi:isoleucyl-tRNA synthetase
VPPYKAVLTHGFVVDGEGRKYSKSAKNYVPPDKILKELGAELLRLWVAAEDYRNDIRVSDEIIKVLAEVYRKIRNTCRFLLGNLYDFDPAKNSVSFEKRTELDRYALHLLAEVVTKVQRAYENYEFHVVHHALNKFFTVDLSATYLDILKDRLYCDGAQGFLRRAAQSTLYDILISVVPLMAPILSFTAEEIWSFIPKAREQSASVFLAPLPCDVEKWKNVQLARDWERIGQIRTEALKALEGARKAKKIGHPLDAKVVVTAQGSDLAFLKRYGAEWTQIFIVSQVEIREGQTPIQVEVLRADGGKCERCWNYSLEVGKNSEHPTVCERCVKAAS